MRPRLILATVTAALTLPLVGFLVVSENASEHPGHESTQPAPGTATRVAAPTTPPSGSEGASAQPTRLTEVAEPARPRVSESQRARPEPSGLVESIPRPEQSDPALTPSRPKATPSMMASRIAKAADSPSVDWSAPSLIVGTNDISSPGMTSGRTATALVACTPSSTCTLSGNSLTISGAATRVTVTWRAPGTCCA